MIQNEKPDQPVPQIKWDRHCRRCGHYIDDQPHSWCLGPQAGHYCWGCEPPGVECMMVTEPSVAMEYSDRKLNDDWGT